ncbi:MAG: glycosyltransferase [Verrucomicrobiaceae bacterium]|jgi:glycosyltransferase involved in cell wall biosynthesis|nr:glycosyltransferase [Verrucomicrobiaceae bacterium]
MKTIVIAAYSCAPDFGSEERVGWQAVLASKGRYAAHVFVQGKSGELIGDEMIAELSRENIYIHIYDLGALALWIAEKSKVLKNLYYSLWHIRLADHITKTIDIKDVDIAHHVSWARYSTPTSLWKLGKPLVIGPVGGADVVPFSLLSSLRLRDQIIAITKSLLIRGLRFFPRIKRSYKESSVALACTSATEAEIKKMNPAANVKLMPLLTFSDPKNWHASSEKFRVIATGRLLGWKGFGLVIEAFFKSSELIAELVIVGDGPDRRRLESMVLKLQVAGGKKTVKFLGNVSNDRVWAELGKASVFCFGSMHDSGGYSILEAMSVGLPVVCLDLAGNGIIVDETCGIKIAAGDKNNVSQKMADALDRISHDQELHENLSLGAKRRLEDFSLEKYRSQVHASYEQCLETECQYS